MINRKLYSLFALMIISAPSPAGAVDAAKKAGLEPHKALYEIDLVSTRGGSQIVNIDGQMLYEWSTGCDAWNSNHRFNLLYEYADSAPLTITSDFSTFEPFDGKSLDFVSQRKKDSRVFEELRGHAELGEDFSGKAVYNVPDGLSYDLKKQTYFPMRHTLELISQAKAGKKFFTATMFDGSDEEGPVQVTAFVGEEVEKPALMKNVKLNESLLENRAWKVRMAFFPLNNEESTSDYEMDVILHENGIISDMHIEYEDFAITQKLIALESTQTTCTEKNTQ